MSISQGRRELSVFIFQTMPQDERRPPAPVPRGKVGPTRGGGVHRAGMRVGSWRHAATLLWIWVLLSSVGVCCLGFGGLFCLFGLCFFFFLFVFLVLFYFCCWWFCLYFYSVLSANRKGAKHFSQGSGDVTGGPAEAGGCSTQGGLHPGGLSALSRPPTGDKLPVPQSPPRAPRPSPSGKGRGSLLQPRCRVPAVQPWPSPTSAPAAPDARRCTKPRARVRRLPPGMRASTRGAARPLLGV